MNAVLITGLVITILGFLANLIGTSALAINASQKVTSAWWITMLIVVGNLLLVVGLIFMASGAGHPCP